MADTFPPRTPYWVGTLIGTKTSLTTAKWRRMEASNQSTLLLCSLPKLEGISSIGGLFRLVFEN